MKINLKEHLSLTEKRNAKSDLLFSRKRNRRRCAAFRNTQKGLAFILPSFAGVCIFWLIPYVDVIRRSFCGAVNGEFVGIENYRTIFANKAFRLAAGNTLRFFGVCVPLLVVLSLIIAVLLAGQKRFTQILKSFFLLPMAIPVASVVLLWRLLFDDQGLLNHLLHMLSVQTTDWMNTGASFYVLVISYIWRNLGYDVVLWMAGFFALMLLFTFLSRAADSVNVAQVETKTAQNQVITHEVTGTGKVMGTRERAVFTQEGQKVEQVYVQEGQNVKKGDALLKFSVKYLKKTIKEKQDAIDVLQGKINDLISAESVNQQKRNNEFSDAQENYNSAVSSGNYSVQAAQNEAAIARQKLQDYYAQRDAAQNDVQDKIPDEEKFSDSSEFDDPGNTDDFGNTDDPENSDDSGNTDRTDGEGNKNTSGNGDNSNAQDNSQEQALIDDIRAKEEAVNEAMLSRRRELQSAEQAIRDTQIGDASDSTLENTQAELETAQKDLETLQKVLARKGKVKAPCDGVIKSLSAVTGSQTGAEAAVVLYETKGTFRFQAEVSKDDLKYIKSGGEVILKGADEKEITGAKVESVKEDSSNENQYILSVQVPEGTLSIGDTAEFTISQDAGPFNVCVPLSALYEENGRYYVYVTDTQNTVLGEVLVARKTYVNVKDKNSSTAALENGDLSSDQKIVTSSDREISSGSRIRLLEE